MLGTFVALDLLLFFVFFEVVLVPMWFVIAQWGDDKVPAAGVARGQRVHPLHRARQRGDAARHPARRPRPPARSTSIALTAGPARA